MSGPNVDHFVPTAGGKIGAIGGPSDSGDLDLTNVIVTEDHNANLTLKLIDYDNTWIPELAVGYEQTEGGHEHFQHPALFDVFCDVDENGTFIPTTVSIPANASGKYRIHATSKLQDNVQPGQSDYQQQPANTNTIANNILTFGDDPNAPFVADVKFLPPSQPPPPLNDETGLFYSALGAAAPAALSIGFFFIMWMRRRNEGIVYQLPSGQKPDLRSALSFAWLRSGSKPRLRLASLFAFLPFRAKKTQMPSPTHQEYSIAPPPINFLLTRFLPLHERLLENAKRPRSTDTK